MGYLDEYLMLGTGSDPSTKYPGEQPYTPPLATTTSSSPTFDQIDAKWGGNYSSLDATPYTPQPTTTGTTTTVPRPPISSNPLTDAQLAEQDSRWDLTTFGGTRPSTASSSTNTSPSSYDPRTGQYTTVPSPILNTLTSPVAPMSVAPPTLSQSSLNRYIDTFNNPETYCDEYSQGRGTQFTEGAARAMAKAGRTGMLPTLNTLAHQDYMTNYLPQVRKDLAPSLQYENTQNQTYVDQYGKELGFSSDRYKTDVTRYGAELDSWIKTLDINTRRDLDVLKMSIDTLNIETTSKDRMFESIAKMWPELSAEDRAYVMAWLQGESGLEGYGAASLAESTAPSGSTTTPTNAGVVYPEGYTG